LELVLYGDSMLTFPPNRGAIDAYVEMLEEDFGVHVNMRLPGMGPCCSPPVIAEYLTTDRAKSELEGADVVIIESPVSGLAYWVATVAGFEGLDPADCGGDDDQQCLRDSLAEYKDGVEEIFSLLTEAVDPSETLIRAVDGYALMVEDQTAAGTLQMTNPYWQEAQEFFAETAAKYGIPTASMFAEFNGPDGTDDPQDRGLIATDRVHPNEAGALLIAELIHDLGYDFAD
jgi:lysophospholipase L1-like esterase